MVAAFGTGSARVTNREPRLAQQLGRWIVLQIIGKFADQIAHRHAGIVNLPVLVGIHAGAAGEANVLLALGGLEQRHRQQPARAEQIDLEDQEVAVDLFIKHEVERRVGGDAAIPVMFAFDDDGRKARRQRAGRHDVLGADLLAEFLELEIVEIP